MSQLFIRIKNSFYKDLNVLNEVSRRQVVPPKFSGMRWRTNLFGNLLVMYWNVIYSILIIFILLLLNIKNTLEITINFNAVFLVKTLAITWILPWFIFVAIGFNLPKIINIPKVELENKKKLYHYFMIKYIGSFVVTCILFFTLILLLNDWKFGPLSE
jgi:hypothetical protein